MNLEMSCKIFRGIFSVTDDTLDSNIHCLYLKKALGVRLRMLMARCGRDLGLWFPNFPIKGVKGWCWICLGNMKGSLNFFVLIIKVHIGWRRAWIRTLEGHITIMIVNINFKIKWMLMREMMEPVEFLHWLLNKIVIESYNKYKSED